MAVRHIIAAPAHQNVNTHGIGLYNLPIKVAIPWHE
jgi:hypothetical protein